MGDFISSIACYGVFEAIPAALVTAAIYLCARIIYLKTKNHPRAEGVPGARVVPRAGVVSRKSLGTELSRVLFAGYIAALVIIVFMPMLTWSQLLSGDFRFEDLRAVGYYTNNGRVWDFLSGNLSGGSTATFELIANVALFIPLGFLLPMSFRRLKWWAVDLIGLGTTCLVELVQPYLGRTGDLDDVITNALGTVIGCIIAKAVLGIRKITQKSAESP